MFPIISVALAGVLLASSLAVPAAAEQRDPAWVQQRCAEWQPTASERRWESIGWARDIRHALTLAKKHSRPVFLFTLDGRMNVGRC